jgi:2-dehydro-3-deoxyphosphogluconate aldolase / (4S)-4-hydroxy-2-oxoglutarate aldolase
MLDEKELFATRIVPVVVLEDAADAEPLAEALVAGGLPVAEVTFRTAAAAKAIRAMSTVPGMIVGAGTVVSAEQVDEAADAGATFIVSPGLSTAVIRRARERGLVVIPGAVTPTEIMAALELGLTTVKFFPANTFGGAAALKSLGAPFRGIRFVPTGGVSAANLTDYLSLTNVVAVGGSWMVDPRLIGAGDFAAIRGLAAEAVAAAASVGEGAERNVDA